MIDIINCIKDANEVLKFFNHVRAVFKSEKKKPKWAWFSRVLPLCLFVYNIAVCPPKMGLHCTTEIGIALCLAKDKANEGEWRLNFVAYHIDCNMLTNYIDNIVTVVVAAMGGGGGAWLFARKKYKAEVEDTNIDNMRDSLDFYVKVSEANQEKLSELLKENSELRAENRKLKDEVDESRRRIHNLELSNQELQGRLNVLEEKLNNMRP